MIVCEAALLLSLPVVYYGCMNSKSSTALAFISVLAILMVLFIALSNVEEAPIRKPFASLAAENGTQTSSSNTIAPDNNPQASSGSADTGLPDVTHTQPTTDSGKIITWIQPDDNNGAKPDQNAATENLPVPAVAQPAPTKIPDSLLKNINSELLDKVGYKDIIVKPLPFDGKIFEQFDLSMLSYLDIVEKKVTQMVDGNEVEALQVYEFNFSEGIGTQEIYDFLKAKIKDELGVTINETNQFGLSSFYINFHDPKDRAFLVVKTRSNVYALSYPKAKDGDNTYFELVSKLLAELI